MSECELCGTRTPLLSTRIAQIEVEVECCPACDVRLGPGAIPKAERRKYLQKQSRVWADDLHGKRVRVFWDDNTHPVNCSPLSKYSVKGSAYRVRDTSGGWGQVGIGIDFSENHRIYEDPHRRGYGIIDDQEYGLFLTAARGGSWYTLVSWGWRKSLVVEGEELGHEQA